jgi:hypothetical protein
MIWIHGQFRYLDNGHVAQFRYAVPDGATYEDKVAEVQKMSHGCEILWMEDGFTPSKPEEWSGWSMNENFDPARLAVEELPCV